jgi:hypothetical protein
MDKSGVGGGFLRELRFPLPIYIPYASPQSSSLSPEAGTIGQEWPQCQQPHTPNNNKKGSCIIITIIICLDAQTMIQYDTFSAGNIIRCMNDRRKNNQSFKADRIEQHSAGCSSN